MELNQHTIEAWILDWMEGNLTPSQEESLHAFVAENPQFLCLMEMADFPMLQAPTSPSINVSSFKKQIVPVGSIDETNWEHYFLLYTEKQLTAEQQQAVELFVQQNPALSRDFKLYNQSKLEADTSIVFEGKAAEKHIITSVGSINETNWEQYIIEAVEGQLNQVSQKDVFAFLHANESLQNEYRSYKKAVLKADPAIVYPAKSSLKKGGMVIAFRDFRNQIMAVAATLLALLGIFWMLNQVDFNKGQVAETTKNTAKPLSPKKPGEYKLVPLIETKSDKSGSKSAEKTTEPVSKNRKKAVVEPAENSTTTVEPTPAPEVTMHDDIALMETLPATTILNNGSTPISFEAPIAMDVRNAATQQKPASAGLPTDEKSFLTPLEIASNFIKQKTGLELKKPQPQEDLLVAGTEGLNKVFNTKWKLERQRDANGDVVAFSFTAGPIEFSRNR